MSQSPKQSLNPSGMQVHAGGCHCGAVRYEARLDLSTGASRCNCSICQKTAATGMGGKPGMVRVVKGEEHLSSYGVGDSPNKRFFCKHCGIHLFGKGDVAELGGPFESVNINTLDDVELSAMKIGYWDGRHDNWQAGMRPEPWPVHA